MNELLAIVGMSWRPVLLFPGLLTCLLLTFGSSFLWKRPPVTDASRTKDARGRWAGRDDARLDHASVTHVACMTLMLAFLPVPGSGWRYGLDVVVALALVEVPHWYRLRRRLGSADAMMRGAAAAEVGTLLNSYLLLVLAVAAVAQANSTLVLAELRGGTMVLWWAGIVVWGVALPPLLTLGSWRVGASYTIGDLVRRVAHIALLLVLALPTGAGYPGLAVAAVAAFGALAALDHWWRGRAESWERLQPLIVLALLGLLMYTAATAWYARAH